MTRKMYQGTLNDKSRTIQKMLEAVGQIIKTKGYKGLTPSNIAREAGSDRRLISMYFGSLDNLIETYVRSKDYWLEAAGQGAAMIEKNTGKDTLSLLDYLLQHQLDYFLDDQEMQKLILWQISESSQIMTEICAERELISKSFFQLSDQELKGKDIDLRAVSALLVAGIYYLVLHTKSTDTTFCEIDLKTKDGMDRIRKAITLILKQTYGEG